MAEERVDTTVVTDFIKSLKASLDGALNSLSKGGTIGSLVGRRALEDQNTGCQNSGCGGGAAAQELPR
jgi:hypothetical protein